MNREKAPVGWDREPGYPGHPRGRVAARPTLRLRPPAVAARDFSPADESFGPHVRDLVVTDGGKLAVLNTMNWDHNLYALDVASGKLRWRQRAGHYFAFEPRRWTAEWPCRAST